MTTSEGFDAENNTCIVRFLSPGSGPDARPVGASGAGMDPGRRDPAAFGPYPRRAAVGDRETSLVPAGPGTVGLRQARTQGVPRLRWAGSRRARRAVGKPEA